MKQTLSAYTINKDGILCYTGLPTEHDDLTIEHHNGEPYPRSLMIEFTLHEVFAVQGFPNMGFFSLIHGRLLANQFGFLSLKSGNCWRAIPIKPINPNS